MLADVASGSAEQWDRQVRSADAVMLGAWSGDQLVGIATGVMAVDDGDVHLVVVDPDHRRQGIGGALTTALCGTLAALGAERVLLEVRAENTAAIALYTAVGFREIARRQSYYRSGDDALVLALDTAPAP